MLFVRRKLRNLVRLAESSAKATKKKSVAVVCCCAHNSQLWQDGSLVSATWQSENIKDVFVDVAESLRQIRFKKKKD